MISLCEYQTYAATLETPPEFCENEALYGEEFCEDHMPYEPDPDALRDSWEYPI